MTAVRAIGLAAVLVACGGTPRVEPSVANQEVGPEPPARYPAAPCGFATMKKYLHAMSAVPDHTGAERSTATVGTCTVYQRGGRTDVFQGDAVVQISNRDEVWAYDPAFEMDGLRVGDPTERAFERAASFGFHALSCWIHNANWRCQITASLGDDCSEAVMFEVFHDPEKDGPINGGDTPETRAMLRERPILAIPLELTC